MVDWRDFIALIPAAIVGLVLGVILVIYAVVSAALMAVLRLPAAACQWLAARSPRRRAVAALPPARERALIRSLVGIRNGREGRR